MRSGRLHRSFLLLAAAGVITLLTPAAANAAPLHVAVPMADVLDTLTSPIGDVFSAIGGAVLGAFTWTIKLASSFILTTIGAVVHMLIPRSWVHQGLQIMQWIVAVPNYAGHVTSPGGGTQYGFHGINALRDMFQWLGIAIAPLTLVYGTSRAMVTESEPVGIPILRFIGTAVVIAAYPYWWTELSALADNITNVILSVPAVTSGLYKLMTYITSGVALGGWQIVDLGMMLTLALELLGLIFLKVVIILVGALLYATGPLALGLVPTRAGSALARAWASAGVALIALGIAWASLFAVGAVLVGDSSSAGPLVAGTSALGSIAGGLLLACAGAVSLWLCLKLAREVASVLRMQLSGLLVIGNSGSGRGAQARSAGSFTRTTSSSLRTFGQRLAGAAGAARGAAGGQLAYAGAGAGALAAGGALLGKAGRGAAFVGRRGLAGTAAAGIGRAARAAAPHAAGSMSRSRAGAVAVQMAKAGTASWRNTTAAAAAGAAHRRAPSATASTTTGTRPAGTARPTQPPSSTPLKRRRDSDRSSTPPPRPAAPKKPPRPQARWRRQFGRKGGR